MFALPRAECLPQRVFLSERECTDIRAVGESPFFDNKLDVGLIIDDFPAIAFVFSLDGLEVLDRQWCTSY